MPENGDHAAGLTDVPRLVSRLADLVVELGKTRVQLTGAEIREEIELRMRRLLIALLPVGLAVLAAGLITYGFMILLARRLGLPGAAFALAAIYLAIGLVTLLWVRATGGLSPRSHSAGEGR